MPLIDQPRPLLGGSLHQGDGIAELLKFRGIVRRGGGPFDDREPRTGQAFHGIGFALVEVNLAVSLVAGRLPHRDRGAQRQAIQPLQKVLGILPGDIQPNVKVNSGMILRELRQRGLELLISGRRLREMKRLGRRSFLLIQKRHVMSITSRINSDSQRHRGTGLRHDNLLPKIGIRNNRLS